jgi:hypothetical protein
MHQRPALEHELARILGAIEINGDGAVSLASHPASPSSGTASAEAGLQALLYQHCYCNRFGYKLDDAGAGEPAAFVARLSTANASRDRWQAGWQIVQVLSSGQIVATRAAVTRLAWPGEFMSHSGPGIAPQPGAPISLFAPRGSTTMQQGFYFAFGEALTDWQDQEGIVRIYWNVRPAGAALLIGQLTTALNRFAIPFQFKCLDNPAAFPRTDAAVLYIARRLFRIAAQLISEFTPVLADALSPTTPLFTKPLGPSIGLSEDPGNGESFGRHRCRLLAAGVLRAHSAGDASVAGRLAAVRQVFGENGFSLAAPYLNPGSADDYPFPVPP